MTPSQPTPTQNELVSMFQSMLDSANTLTQILSKAFEDLLKIQFESGTGWLSETVPNLVPAPSNEAPTNMLWQTPNLYKTQSQRLVGSMSDTVPVWLHAQQQLMAWSEQSLSASTQQVSQTMSRLFGAFASRRVATEGISFSDRRLTAQSAAPPVEMAHIKSERGSHHDAKRTSAD